MPGVGPVGLGVPLAAPGERSVGRLSQMRRDPGRGEFLGHIPPPGAPLDRERDIITAAEPGQPGPQVLPVRRADLPALHLPGHGVEVVEGDLLPVNIQPAYDGHRDLLTHRRGAGTRPKRIAYAINRDASALGRSPGTRPPTSAQPGPMHVI